MSTVIQLKFSLFNVNIKYFFNYIQLTIFLLLYITLILIYFSINFLKILVVEIYHIFTFISCLLLVNKLLFYVFHFPYYFITNRIPKKKDFLKKQDHFHETQFHIYEHFIYVKV